jgi:cytochrome c oxidase cbb3-type subunit 3
MCLVCRALALVWLCAACDGKARETASAGAPVPVEIPVGPVPGPSHPEHAANPWANDAASRQEGYVLFQRYNCAGCHGDHGGGGMGPSLRDERWLYGDTDEKIFNSIAEGRGHGMPAWGVKLPDEHVWKLVSYIHSLRTANEPQPPSPARGPMP